MNPLVWGGGLQESRCVSSLWQRETVDSWTASRSRLVASGGSASSDSSIGVPTYHKSTSMGLQTSLTHVRRCNQLYVDDTFMPWDEHRNRTCGDVANSILTTTVCLQTNTDAALAARLNAFKVLRMTARLGLVSLSVDHSTP